MVMNNTKAVAVRIHALSPLSSASPAHAKPPHSASKTQIHRPNLFTLPPPFSKPPAASAPFRMNVPPSAPNPACIVAGCERRHMVLGSARWDLGVWRRDAGFALMSRWTTTTRTALATRVRKPYTARHRAYSSVG